MKAVILCGGRGTRLAEETKVTPKPLVEVGGIPIVIHIINHYLNHGISEFILATGYLADQFTAYFSDSNKSRLSAELFGRTATVTVVNTGEETLTGGRLLRLKPLLTDENFLLTYGDGLTNSNIKESLEFHMNHKKKATITAVRPPARFGVIQMDEKSAVNYFQEKNQTDAGWINGGFFVFNKSIFDYLEDDKTVLEEKPLRGLTKESELMAFKHHGFWQCMDTIRDREYLEELWANGKAPWNE